MVKQCTLFVFFVCFFPALIFSQNKLDIIDIEAQQFAYLSQLEAAATNNPNGSNIDEKYVRFNLTMSPSVSPATITGSVTHYFTTTSDNVQTIKYDLYNVGMDIVSLKYHGVTYTATSVINHIVDTVVINLPAPIPTTGTLDSVTISYKGTPPQSSSSRGYKRSSMSSKSNLSTHSSGYFARQWWPCKHTLGDKIDSVDIYVTAPSANRVVGNGLLQTSNPPIISGNKTWWWKSRYPVAGYLIAIAVYPYTVYNSPAAIVNGTTVPITNYLTSGTNTSTIRAAVDAMKPVLEHYSTLFGDYPFKNEKYGHVAYTFGGGMENQTASYIGTGSLSSKSLLAHELSHQWWGDKVTCNSWGNIWVNEGFARYAEILYSEKFETASAAQTKRASYKNGSGVNSTTNTVYRYDTEIVTEADHTAKIFVSSMVYNKAAIIISMLRKLVGETQFFAALKNYIADPLLAYGSASTEDVQRHFEAVSGLDLTSFFDDFIYKAGYPIYTVNWGTTASGPYQTAINYTQAKSTGSTVAYYNTVLPIRLRNATLAKDTMVYIFDDVSLNGTNIYFNTSFPVTSIEVDPYSEAYTYSPVVNAPSIVVSQQMLSLEGSINETGAALKWQAAESKDFSHFEIERSADGNQFEAIADIPGAKDNLSYLYGDEKVLAGNNYYRLKMMDPAGNKVYSNTILLQFSAKVKIRIWPNPATSKIIISKAGATISSQSLRLINAAGHTVAPTRILSNGPTVELTVTTIPNGIYWLEIKQKDGTKQVERIVIRH